MPSKTPLPLTGQLSPCAPLVGDGSTELSRASTIVASRWPALPLLTRGPLALPRPMMRRGGRVFVIKSAQDKSTHNNKLVFFIHMSSSTVLPRPNSGPAAALAVCLALCAALQCGCASPYRRTPLSPQLRSLEPSQAQPFSGSLRSACERVSHACHCDISSLAHS